MWHQGMVYEGEFKEGMRHGNGVWRESNSPNATSYEGEYSNDKKHGEGLYKWRSGSYYKGSFYNDQRDGYGEMYWIDGSSYKGQWEKGAQKGEGIMTYADGTVQHIRSHQRNASEISSYISQEELLSNQFGSKSDKKHKLKIKLINHNRSQLPSTTNKNLSSNKAYETSREDGERMYNNFMKLQGTHKRYHSKGEFPHVFQKSHYSIQPQNKSFDLRIGKVRLI
jgi:hypothetical protein